MAEQTTEQVGNDIIAADSMDVSSAIESINSGNVAVASSFTGDDFETRKGIMKAMSSSEPVADHLDKEIKLANYVIHAVEMPDENTGELREVARVILIDDKGKAYHAISGAMFKRLETIVGIVGHPENWDSPISVKVTQRKGNGPNKFYDLALV